MYLKKHTFQKFGEVLYKVHENKVGILQEIDSSTFYINSEISVICARECNHLMELDTSIMGVQQERRKIKFPFPQFGGWHGCMLNWPRQECIIGAARRTSGGF
ncbi:hypothetical protein ACP275_08G103700 [Erythranthe tilingii]